MKTPRWWLVCLCTLLFGFTTPGYSEFLAPLSMSLPAPSLTRPIGKGTLAITYDFKQSDEFFSSSGSLLNSGENYTDHLWNLHFDYGLTDRFTFMLNVPLRYRYEDQLLDADDFGIGDARLSFLYSILSNVKETLQLAVTTTIKFPSGDADIQLLNLTGSVDRELPLGSGQYDWLAGLQGRLRLHDLHLRGAVDFMYRFADVVEYVQVFQLSVDSSGNPIIQAVGNGEISYGHELHYKLLAEYQLANRFTIGIETALRQILPGSGESFSIGATDISKSTTRLPAGYELTLAPQLSWFVKERWNLAATAIVPIAGDDRPIIPLVDSLIGIHYMVSLGYAY